MRNKSLFLSALAALLLLCATFGAMAVPAQGSTFEALSAQERKWLDENQGAIVLAYEANFPPLEFRTKDGKHAGFSADLIGKIEKLLGVRFRKVPSYDFNEQLASLQSGDTHLCAVMMSTPERERFAYFTGPYISLPLVIITSKTLTGHVGWGELSGRRVGVVSGYAAEKYVREKAAGSFTVVPVGSVREGLRDVSFGVLDAFVENLASASYYIEKDTLTNLRVAAATDYSYHMSIGVSRKYPLLYSAVQKALSEISNEEMEAARKQWISLSGGGVLSPESWRVIKLAGVFTVLLLLGLGGISYYLKRRLGEKVESLRLAQQELLEQTERLGLATEATNAGVWDFYPDTGQAYFSDQWFAMLGYEPGAVEASFAGWVGLIHPEDRVTADHALMGYIDTGGEGLFEAEYRARQADGSYRWVLGKGRAIAWDQGGIPTRLVGLNLDIQKLKTVQEELRKSEALARASFDQTFQLCGLLTTDGLVVNVNRRSLGYSGVSREALLGRPFWDCPWWPDRQKAEGILRQAMATVLEGGTFRREVDNVDAQGNKTLVDFSLSPLTGVDGSVEFFIVEGRDVTEMRQAEAALKESEEKFRAIFSNSPVGIFRTTFDGQLLEANTALARMHACGSVEEYVLWAKDLGKDRYAHPEDRQRLLDALLKNPSGASLGTELRRRDGSTCHGIINAVLHLDEHGVPALIDGTIEDITERKRLELRLADQLAFQQALLDTIPYAVFYKGADTHFVGFNKAYEECFGVRRENLIGKRVLDLEYLPAEDREAYQTEDEAVIASVGQVEREMPFLFADGRLHHTLYSVTGFRLTDGTPGGLIGVIVDITELKQAEEALKRSEEIYRTLFMNTGTATIVVEEDTTIALANAEWEKLVGVPREEMEGRMSWTVFFSPENLKRMRGYHMQRRDFPELAPRNYESELIDAKGKHHNVELTVAMIPGTKASVAALSDITERKRAEEALRESEERYRSVIQNMRDVYYRTDAEGRIVMMSPSGLRLYGCDTMDEVRAMPSEAFYMNPAERLVILSKIQAEGAVHDFELTLRRKDGSPVLIATTSNFYYDTAGNVLGVEGILRDITERKRVEEALRQSEEKFSRIFELAPESISFVRLRDSVRIAANAAFETITGYPRQDSVGYPAPDLGIWDDPAMRGAFLKKLQVDGHVKDFEFLLRRKDGALRRVVSSAQLVSISGEECYVNVIHDITDERRMQELLIQSEKMMSVGSLAAGIAHEINNPLGIVHQAVQNLILRTNPEQKKNLETAAGLGLEMDKLQAYLKARKLDVFLEDIQAAALRASGIIRNMLNFSRRSESTRQPCDLHRIIEQSLFLASSDYDLKKAYDFKRIEIVQDFETDLPACSCTETEIEQVLLNLLRNAAQAMSLANPPTANPRIDIRLRTGKNCVRIEVADNGPGMDGETQRKALEPFFTTKPPGVGTGLGLSVSYFIVTKGHGGRMWLSSALGRGTTFFIELPTDEQETSHA